MSDLSAIVKTLNGLDPEAAIATLLRCCGSKRWAASLAAARPFDDQRHLLEAAELGWWALGAEDWKEAFSNHPKIGADVDALRAKYAATADWSAGEQSGVAGASEATIQALAKGNSEYDAKFGHVFLICATGKSAEEMLAALKERLPNNAETELRNAATEQSKITKIRLEKLEI